MEAFSIRDLQARSEELVRELENGHPALITKQGRPLCITVPLEEHLIEAGLPLALAVELYRGQTVSLGLAAKIAGLSYVEFIEQLGRLRISILDYDPDELDRELKLLE